MTTTLDVQPYAREFETPRIPTIPPLPPGAVFVGLDVNAREITETSARGLSRDAATLLAEHMLMDAVGLQAVALLSDGEEIRCTLPDLYSDWGLWWTRYGVIGGGS